MKTFATLACLLGTVYAIASCIGAPRRPPTLVPSNTATLPPRACYADTASCNRVTTRRLSASFGSAPVNNPLWSQPFWAIDDADSTGCASDGNNCTSATCGGVGIGPCLTWEGVNDTKWGCAGGMSNCPILMQDTEIFRVSSQSASTIALPSVFKPGCGYSASLVHGASIYLHGALTTTSTGLTLTTLTPKNAAAGQALTVTPTAGDFPLDTLVQNLTHPSYSMVIARNNGVDTMSQPTTITTLPTGNGSAAVYAGTEVDTWASTDTFATVAVPTVFYSEITPTVGTAPQDTCQIQIAHLNLAEVSKVAGTGNTGDAPLRIGSKVQIIEAFTQRRIEPLATSSDFTQGSGIHNVGSDGGFVGGLIYPYFSNAPNTTRLSLFQISAGYLHANGGTGGLIFSGVKLFNDVEVQTIFGSNVVSFVGYSVLGNVAIDSRVVVLPGGTADLKLIPGTVYGNGGAFGTSWDSSGLTSFRAGAGGAAATFGGGAGGSGWSLLSQGLSTMCWETTTSATRTCAVPASITVFDADLGVSSGCFGIGPGGFCNSGP